MGGVCHHLAFLFGVAAPFFYHGRRPECELILRHCDLADRNPFRGASLQLDSHDVSRESDFCLPHVLVYGLYHHIYDGRHGRIIAGTPPADFQMHNSLFLVAHFHTMIVGVALFGIFAGITYWFPKIFGFTLDERLGKGLFGFG